MVHHVILLVAYTQGKTAWIPNLRLERENMNKKNRLKYIDRYTCGDVKVLHAYGVYAS